MADTDTENIQIMTSCFLFPDNSEGKIIIVYQKKKWL